RVTFQVGKSWDGYYSCDDVLAQTSKAMDLLMKHYPDYNHLFVFDNAPTHLKCADDALSAHNMPKGIQGWGVDVTMKDDAGKVMYGPNGKPLKTKVQMANGRLSNGTPELLYFPDGHQHTGKFKGMAQILKEHRFTDVHTLKAQCKDFKCKEGATNCCYHQILFNQPYFVNIPSLLQTHCSSHGFGCLILPKFHCELNFIEQCWGFAKCIYHEYPPSSKILVMEENIHKALDSIPLESIQHFANLSSHFIDAYHKGLNGKQAARTAKKYCGHHILPKSILKELDEQHIV
ncbi:hypothetical protein PAXRUDRAFT_157910, partial [Paxillus rubicundulus Ve08.2h10]